MRPLREVINVDAPLSDALARFRMCDQSCLVVVNGDEVVGLLSRDRTAPESVSVGLDGIGIADLMQPPTATCRPSDGIASVRKLLDNLGRDTALVVDHDNQLIGLVGAAKGARAGGDGEVGGVHGCPADDLGGRDHDRPFGEFKVYSQRPHPDRSR